MKKLVGIMALMMCVLVSLVFAGNEYQIQHPVGTPIVIINESGSINASGVIYEENVLLSDIYWAIIDVATPNDGDTTHLSTAGQIFAYIAGLDYVPGAWNSLSNMTLNDGLIYVGDASNNPAAQTMSGHATITNAGVVSVVNTAGLSGENITSGIVADAYIAATIARDSEVVALIEANGNFTAWGYNFDDMVNTQTALSNFSDDVGYFTDIANFTGTLTNTKSCIYTDGTGIVCDTTAGVGTVTSIATTGPIAGGTITSTGTISLTACADEEIYQYNSTEGAWECEPISISGISKVVEDLTPQLGGNLDLNDFAIDSAGDINMSITATRFIIVI